MTNLLNPQEYIDGISSIKAVSLNGQQFINESTSYIKTNPFNASIASNIIVSAKQSNDANVIKWANSLQERIDENFITFNIELLCESTKYNSSVFGGFKSVALDLLKNDEASIVRQIAVDGVLNNFSMLPEIKQLIFAAKNIQLSKLNVTATYDATSVNNNIIEHCLGIATQISDSAWLIGFDGEITAIQDKSTNTISLVNYSDIVATLQDDYVLDFDGFKYAIASLQNIIKYYNSIDAAFTFNLLNNKVVWRLTDNALFLNDNETTIAKINQVVQAKAAALSINATKLNADEYNLTNTLLPMLNQLYELRDYIVLLDTIVKIKNNDNTVYVSCISNTDLAVSKPYTYVCFTKYVNSTTCFTAIYDNYAEFIAQFVSADTKNTVNSLFANEIKVEKDYANTIANSKAELQKIIDDLQLQKDALLAYKDKLPESSLNAINAQIMTIDDLIARNQRTAMQ